MAVVVAGAGNEIEGFGFRGGVEDGSAEFDGDDVVLLAVDDERSGALAGDAGD